MNIPASPGGVHSNRKTRHGRHRLGEAEDVPHERGRKRKAGDDDGNESPNPGLRPATQDGSGGLSPFQEHRAKTLRSQQEAPAYSIDSIFTEKELSHATTVAQYATHHFFHHQQANEQNGAQGNGKSASAEGTDGGVESNGAGAAGAGTSDRAPSPPGASQPEAAGMERQVSNYATRGATRANPLSFLSDTALAVSTNESTVNPFLPAMIPITRTDKGAPTPPSASHRDIQLDLTMMFGKEDIDVPSDWFTRPPTQGGDGQDAEVTIAEARKLFLEQACREPLAHQPFRLPLTDLGPAMIKDGVNRPAAIGFADPASIPNAPRDNNNHVSAGSIAAFSAAFGGSGVPMSRTTSLGGSDVGGNDVGGVGMRRTRSRAV